MSVSKSCIEELLGTVRWPEGSQISVDGLRVVLEVDGERFEIAGSPNWSRYTWHGHIAFLSSEWFGTRCVWTGI